MDENLELHQRIEGMEETIRELEEKHKVLEIEKSTSEAALKEEHREALERILKSRGDLESIHAQEIEEAQKKVKKLQRELEDLEKKHDEQVIESEKKRQELENRIAQMDRDHETQSKILVETIVKMENDIENKRNTERELRQSLEGAGKFDKGLLEKVTKFERHLAKMEVEKKEINKTMIKLTNEVEFKEKEIQKLKENMKSISHSKEQLESEKVKAERENEKTKRLLELLGREKEKETSELKRKLSEATNQLEKKSEEMINERKKMMTEIGVLKERNVQLKQELEEAANEFNYLDDEVSDLQSQINDKTFMEESEETSESDFKISMITEKETFGVDSPVLGRKSSVASMRLNFWRRPSQIGGQSSPSRNKKELLKQNRDNLISMLGCTKQLEALTARVRELEKEAETMREVNKHTISELSAALERKNQEIMEMRFKLVEQTSQRDDSLQLKNEIGLLKRNMTFVEQRSKTDMNAVLEEIKNVKEETDLYENLLLQAKMELVEALAAKEELEFKLRTFIRNNCRNAGSPRKESHRSSPIKSDQSQSPSKRGRIWSSPSKGSHNGSPSKEQQGSFGASEKKQEITK